jgi:hypothetical protein
MKSYDISKPCLFSSKKERKKERKMALMLSHAWNMALFHFLLGLNLYVILTRTLWELQGLRWLLPPFEGEHHEWAQTSQPTLVSPKGKHLDSHRVGWSVYSTRRPPLWLGESYMIGNGNQVPRGYPSEYFFGLGGLTSEFPWNMGQDLEFEPPF